MLGDGNSWLTISISDKGCVTESNCHSKTKYHEDPINFRYVYPAINPSWCMDNLDTWEATQSKTLFDNWECRWDNSLTSNYSSKSGHHKNWPKKRFCNKKGTKKEERRTGQAWILLRQCSWAIHLLTWYRCIKAGRYVIEVLRKKCCLSHIL